MPFPEHYWQLFLTTKNHLCFSSHDRRSLVYQTKHNFSQLETGPITLRLRRRKKKRKEKRQLSGSAGHVGLDGGVFNCQISFVVLKYFAVVTYLLRTRCGL